MSEPPLKTFAEYWRAGFDTWRIAQQLGVKEETVYRWIVQYGGVKNILKRFP